MWVAVSPGARTVPHLGFMPPPTQQELGLQPVGTLLNPGMGHGRQGLSPASSLRALASLPSPWGTPGPSVRPPLPCRLCVQPS